MREILLEIEGSDDPKGKEFPGRFDAYSSTSGGAFVFLSNGTESRPELRERDYNICLLEDAGLIEATTRYGSEDDFYGGVLKLTNLGHDLIDAISDDGFWKKLVKAAPAEAYDIAKGHLGPIGMKSLLGLLGYN